MYNWITLLCTWNIISQLYVNKICILIKKIKNEYSMKENASLKLIREPESFEHYQPFLLSAL